MKVCIISHAYIEQQGYLPVLQAMGSLPNITLTLITPDIYRGKKFSPASIAALQPLCEIFTLPILFGSRQGTFVYRPAALKRALDAAQPDVILHEQEVYSLGAGQVAAVAARRSVPLAMFVWENIPRELSLPRRRLVRYVIGRCSGLIAGSNSAAEVHRGWGFKGPVQVIPQMGVPSVVETPSFGRRDPACFQVAFAGRLIVSKGVDCLLRAVAHLRAQSLPVHCTIAGDGPEMSNLRQLAQSLGIADIVTMPGSVPLQQVAELLERSDVLVLPSRRTKTWEEQFGRILVEAMAKATVTTGSRTGAIPEVIGSDELLFDEDDDQMLAGLLMKLASDPVFFQKHQMELWQRARDRYLNDALARQRIPFLAGLQANHK